MRRGTHFDGSTHRVQFSDEMALEDPWVSRLILTPTADLYCLGTLLPCKPCLLSGHVPS